jgi:hypothetical protein
VEEQTHCGSVFTVLVAMEEHPLSRASSDDRLLKFAAKLDTSSVAMATADLLSHDFE